MKIRRNCEWRIYNGSKAEYLLTDPSGISDDLVKQMNNWDYKLKDEIEDGATRAVFYGEGTSLIGLRTGVRFSNSKLRRLKRKYPGVTITEQSTENVRPEIPKKITKRRDVVPMSDGVMLYGKRPWFWQRMRYRGKHKQEVDNFYKTRLIFTQVSDVDAAEAILGGSLKEQLGYELPEHDKGARSVTVTNWVPLTKKYMNKERIKALRKGGIGIQRQSNVMPRHLGPKSKEAKRILREIRQVV